MERLSAWLGAGVMTVGMSAAMLAGAAVALADRGPDAGSSGAAGSAGAATGQSASPSAGKKARQHKPKRVKTASEGASEDATESASEGASTSVGATATHTDTEPKKSGQTKPSGQAADPDTAKPKAGDEAGTAETGAAESGEVSREVTEPVVVAAQPETKPDTTHVKEAGHAKTAGDVTELKDAKVAEVSQKPDVPEVAEPGGEATEIQAASAPAKAANAATATARSAAAESTTETAEVAIAETGKKLSVPTPTGLPALVAFVGNVIFGAITLLEQIVTGPPALPAHSTVSVRTSSLTLANGYVASANWYFPDTETAPTRLIYLQHGLLATGPMYSYTAAKLAQQTGAVVVTPTLVSNVLAGEGLWLGGDAMYRAVANLFIGDRKELTASALAAGYAKRYGLSGEDAVLPEQFALAGHSLGGALVAGVAGYLAVNGAADHLVGVISLDGVPTGDTMAKALDRLADYQAETGRVIPVRQIAAPWNLWNSLSTANTDLNALRPGTYNGVILRGGVHMDSMQGGNPLIQFLAYVAAGFPTDANKAAVSQLAVQWLNAWFSGAPEDIPGAGTTIVISTTAGNAYGRVIGTVAARQEDAEVLAVV